MKKSSLLQGFLFIGALSAIGCGGSGDVAPTATALATGQGPVTSIAVEGSFVYWTTADGHVRRVSTEGGPVTEIVSGLHEPSHLAVDDVHVFWAGSEGVIASAPKAGGAVVMLASNENVNDLAIDDAHLYWTAQTGDLKRVVKIGGSSEKLVSAQPFSSGLAVNAAGVFWANGASSSSEMTAPANAVMQLPATDGQMVAGTAAVAIAAVQGTPTHLSVDATNAFWASLPGDTAMNVSASGNTVSQVALDPSGSNPDSPATPDVRIVASNQALVAAVAGDANNLYWTAMDGSVSAASLTGGCDNACQMAADGAQAQEPAVLVQGPAGPVNLAIDDASIYWANSAEGTVMTMPKQ